MTLISLMNMKYRLIKGIKNDSESRCNHKKINLISAMGSTLIEMLIVTAILAIVSLAIYATFNNGVKLWQKINRQIPEEDLDIFFDKFAGDLRNTFKFTNIAFLGGANKLEFTTLINSPRLNKRTVGKVIYFYDSAAATLNREQRDFTQVYSGEECPIAQSLRNVKSLRFQYYLYDKEKEEYIWRDEWIDKDLPLAVRIELEFGDGTQINKFTKTISLPVSC